MQRKSALGAGIWRGRVLHAHLDILRTDHLMIFEIQCIWGLSMRANYMDAGANLVKNVMPEVGASAL